MEEEGKENSYSSPLANTLVMLYFSSPSFDRWKNSSEDTCPFAAPSGFCPHLPVRADVWGHSLGPQALLVSLSLYFTLLWSVRFGGRTTFLPSSPADRGGVADNRDVSAYLAAGDARPWNPLLCDH